MSLFYISINTELYFAKKRQLDLNKVLFIINNYFEASSCNDFHRKKVCKAIRVAFLRTLTSLQKDSLKQFSFQL